MPAAAMTAASAALRSEGRCFLGVGEGEAAAGECECEREGCEFLQHDRTFLECDSKHGPPVWAGRALTERRLRESLNALKCSEVV